MTDVLLRELERSWQTTADLNVGMRLILAKFRAGQPVDLDSFPLELWHKIAADFSIENIAHHLAIGGEQLNHQLDYWADFSNNLSQLGTRFRYLAGSSTGRLTHDALMLISRAAMQQTCKTSVVYYPSLPNDRRIAMYITMVLSPDTLSEVDIQEMQQSAGSTPWATDETTHWGLVLRVFFDPTWHLSGARLGLPPRPRHLELATLIASPATPPDYLDPTAWITKVLNGVSAIYPYPVDSVALTALGPVPFLVLK